MKNKLEKKEMTKLTYGMLGFLFLALLTTPLAKYIGWYFLINNILIYLTRINI